MGQSCVGKKYSLSSKYGDEIKRIEIEGNGKWRKDRRS